MNKSVVTELHAAEPETLSLDDPAYYINRQLSLLQFHRRVLAQALDERYPLLERLQFLMIFCSNMDEFFEVRVAGLRRQISFHRESTFLDGMAPAQVLREIREACLEGVNEQYRILNDIMLPALAQENIRFLMRDQWSEGVSAWVDDYFANQLLPVISPIGLDTMHPFPRLVNKSLNFIVQLEGKDAFGRESGLAIVPAPRSLPRLIRADYR